jgi:hypothetical protein
MDIPAELKDSLDKTIVAMEPRLKQQTGNALKSLYDYFLGKKPSPELAKTLRSTLLSDSFVNSLIDNTDLATVLANTIHDQLNTQGIPRALLPLLDQIKPILTKEEPQLKIQLKKAVPPILDYIVGNTNSFKVTFTMDSVVSDLKIEAKNILKNNPPQELAGIPASQLDPYIDQYITQNLTPQLSDIAGGLTLDQTTIGKDAQLTQPLQKAEDALAQVKPYVAMFQQYYIWLIVLMVLLAAGIVAIHHSVRGATRSLGSIFLSYGIIEFIPLLAFKLLAPKYIFPNMMADIPSELKAFSQQAIFDFMSPLFYFSLGILIAGIVLLVVSFVYRPAQPTITAPATTNEQVQS